MPESHTSDESRNAPAMFVTDIEPIDLIGLNLEEYGWRFVGAIGREYLHTDELHIENFSRGEDVLEIGWVWDHEHIDPRLRLRSPLDINRTSWPVSTPVDVGRVLNEYRQIAQPIPAGYDTTSGGDTSTELYFYRKRIAEEIADLRSGYNEPASDVGVENIRTVDLDPHLPPWAVDESSSRDASRAQRFSEPTAAERLAALDPQHGGLDSHQVSIDVEEFHAGAPGIHEGRYVDPASLPEPPYSLEESFADDAMRIDRQAEQDAAARFAAMTPTKIEAAHRLLSDNPDVVPYNEIIQRGLTLDEMSLVAMADAGDLPEPLDPYGQVYDPHTIDDLAGMPPVRRQRATDAVTALNDVPAATEQDLSRWGITRAEYNVAWNAADAPAEPLHTPVDPSQNTLFNVEPDKQSPAGTWTAGSTASPDRGSDPWRPPPVTPWTERESNETDANRDLTTSDATRHDSGTDSISREDHRSVAVGHDASTVDDHRSGTDADFWRGASADRHIADIDDVIWRINSADGDIDVENSDLQSDDQPGRFQRWHDGLQERMSHMREKLGTRGIEVLGNNSLPTRATTSAGQVAPDSNTEPRPPHTGLASDEAIGSSGANCEQSESSHEIDVGF